MERLHSERPSHVLAVSLRSTHKKVTKDLSTKVLGVCARTQGRASVHAVQKKPHANARLFGRSKKKVRC